MSCVSIAIQIGCEIMLKYLAILAVLVGLAFAIAHHDEYTARQSAQKTADKSSPTIAGKSDENYARQYFNSSIWDSPAGHILHNAFHWPDGTTAWAIILTLLVIAEQTKATRRAAEAARDSVKIQEVEFRQWVQIEDWQVDTKPPKAYSDIFASGAAKPKDVFLSITFTIMNPTPRPLTILRGTTELQLMGWSNYRYFSVEGEEHITPQGKYGVGIDLTLTGDEVDKFWADDHFMSVLIHISYEDALGHKHNWSFPFMSKFGRNGSMILNAYTQAREVKARSQYDGRNSN
jgi:hypothetical protein